MRVETEDGHQLPASSVACRRQEGDGRLKSARVEEGQRASLLFELPNGGSLLAIRPLVPVALLATADQEPHSGPARCYVRLGEGPESRWVSARVMVTPDS